MEKILFCFLLFFSFNSVYAEKIKFTLELPSINAVRLVNKTNVAEMEMIVSDTASGKKMNISIESNEQNEIRETVLAKKDDKITELKVEYLDVNKFQKTMGKTEFAKVPVKGKTYLVKYYNGNPQITNEQGGKIPAEELEIVKKDYGKEENKEMIETLIGQELTVGQRVPFMQEAIQDSFQDKFQDGSISDVVVILKEIRMIDGLRCAVFSVEFFLSTNLDVAFMSVDFTGEVVVAIDKTWVMELYMEGPLLISASSSMEDTSAAGSISGSGKMRVAGQYKYFPPDSK